MYGYTLDENSFKYTFFDIEICDFETLTNTLSSKTFDLVQNTIQFSLAESTFSNYFENNSTRCPVTEYRFIDYYG